MADKSMNKISLKALVHSKRVIFVESDNDFVDVLCSFLTIPMGTIVRLARSRSLPVGIGCMNCLYESAKSMDSKVFRAEKCQDMLLFPRNRGSSLMGKLKLNIDDSDHKMYRCSRFDRCPSGYRFSYYKTVCSCGSPMDSEINFMDNGSQDDGVYVNGESKLIVSDDLQVMPPLTSASSSLFSKLGVVDSNTIHEATKCRSG
ncbi:uncharacterized protein Pyn_23448 [Prunus yedoensis var. nudiflora]|uniref:Uncharacterized protein n=1 Tax=Prunus yedoensis var. nudiflora TaxID=2094558 RepID=A0A314UG39_PRUYE|nr:uncharacterized protein Pyn_23448 [Prunus yedoensis var. nudiflora]